MTRAIHVTPSGEVEEYDCEPVPLRRPFKVDLRSLYDDDDRLTIRVTGIGPNEAKAIAKDLHPDYFVATVKEVAA